MLTDNDSLLFWRLWDNSVKFVSYIFFYLYESKFMLPLEE